MYVTHRELFMRGKIESGKNVFRYLYIDGMGGGVIRWKLI